MLPAMIAATVLVVASILIHYEILRITANRVGSLPIRPHLRIVIVVVAAFFAHTLEVWLYAGGYMLLADSFGLGGIAGQPVTGFHDYLYFSAITYSSLGYGDHYPTGHLRLIAGAEGLNGLLLIGWSASFTYLAMQKYWPLHGGDYRGRRVPLIEEIADGQEAADREHSRHHAPRSRRPAKPDHRR
jgi:hypothetical protein